MEYVLLAVVAFYLLYFAFCVMYFLKQPELKSHEKGRWIFICFSFPILGFLIYRLVARQQRRTFSKTSDSPK